MISLRNGGEERNMVKVVLAGDFHLGAQGVDIKAFKNVVKHWFTGKPIILMGDLIDSGIDRGMQFDNVLTPQEQINLLTEILEPLDIIAYVNGNHENRFFKKTGINILETILKRQPQNKVEVDGRLIYINHGISAAENSFKEFEKYLKFVTADVYALGHNHDLSYKAQLQNGKLSYFVRTGTFMSATKYTIERGYAPKIRGWIEYDTCKHYITLYGLINGGVVRKI